MSSCPLPESTPRTRSEGRFHAPDRGSAPARIVGKTARKKLNEDSNDLEVSDIRKTIVAIFILVFATLKSASANTSPEEACIFFFEYFGDGIRDARSEFADQRVSGEVVFGDPERATLALPRYLRINWPDGIASSGGVMRDRFVVQDNLAFSIECIVDVVDSRVLQITVDWGRRIGEVLPISPRNDGTERSREALSAKRYTINIGATFMQGRY